MRADSAGAGRPTFCVWNACCITSCWLRKDKAHEYGAVHPQSPEPNGSSHRPVRFPRNRRLLLVERAPRSRDGRAALSAAACLSDHPPADASEPWPPGRSRKPREDAPMNHDSSPAYGLWTVAFINAAVFILFAFSFFKP